MIFKLATSHKLDAITLFQAISGFTNPSRESGWDGRDLQTGKFSYFFKAISGFKNS